MFFILQPCVTDPDVNMPCSWQIPILRAAARSLDQLADRDILIASQRWSRTTCALEILQPHGMWSFTSKQNFHYGRCRRRPDQISSQHDSFDATLMPIASGGGVEVPDSAVTSKDALPPPVLDALNDACTEPTEESKEVLPARTPLPPAATTEEFVKRLKKAIRLARRNNETMYVKYDPTDEKKIAMAKEEARMAELNEKKEEVKRLLRKQKLDGQKVETWRLHKIAMKMKFPEGWSPPRKVSPDAMDAMRTLNSQFPTTYTTPVLAEHFRISPEAVRRILKSNWKAKRVDLDVASKDLYEKWNQRGKRIWTTMAAMGMNPPTKWEKQGIVRDKLQIGQRDGQEGNRNVKRMQRKFNRGVEEEYREKLEHYLRRNPRVHGRRRRVRVEELYEQDDVEKSSTWL